MTNSVARKGKPAAIFAYLSIVGTIIAYFMNRDSKYAFASFHVRQAFGIHLTFYLLGLIVSSFDSWLVSAPFYVFIFTLWGHGFISAILGKEIEVPLLGGHFQNWFKTIG